MTLLQQVTSYTELPFFKIIRDLLESVFVSYAHLYRRKQMI